VEQPLLSALGWYAMGLLGLLLRVMYQAMKGKIRRVEHLDDYVRDNSLLILFVLVCYSALVVMWRGTNLVSFIPYVDALDIVPGKINAWSIALCFASDMVFVFVMNRMWEKVGAKFRPDGQDTPS